MAQVKLFVILNKAIQKVLSGDRDFRHICVVRSIVPIRDIGFLKVLKMINVQNMKLHICK